MARQIKQITPTQKKIIWAIWRKEIRSDDEALYAALNERFGVERMSAMSVSQADAFIRDLRRKQIGLSVDRLSPDQYRAILSYAKYLGWDTAHLHNYMKQQVDVDEIRWLTSAQARAILTGLEKIKRHQEKKIGQGCDDGVQRRDET